VKQFVQPDPATGYRFTSYRLVQDDGPWPLTETGYIYHKIDLSDLGEPYLSAVKKSLAEESTPREINMAEVWGG
jgi:hypothetical protein